MEVEQYKVTPRMKEMAPAALKIDVTQNPNGSVPKNTFAFLRPI